MYKWLLIICLFTFPLLIKGQPANYWTNTFNTEASLLSGAVVGGNAGITAIFYNPAGISEIKESRIELNANLFNIEHKRYDNPLGKDTHMENWFFRFYPRFASYLYPSKNHPSITYQFAVFNRNHSETDIYDRVQLSNTNLIYPNMTEVFTGLFTLETSYDDYWGSMGISKIINQNLSIGISINLSIQSFKYFRTANSNVLPTSFDADTTTTISSNWSTYERIDAYNWRFIGKLGMLYKKGNLSAGLNISLPSIRLFGTANLNKTISQSNIFYNRSKLADYYINEYPQGVYFKMQDPLSIALGFMLKEPYTKTDFFITLEYYNAIDPYYTVDSRKGDKEKVNTSFSSYEFGNRDLLNIAIGFKKMLSEKLGFLAGMRTDFNPYIMSYRDDIWGDNSFENSNTNLLHINGGIKFDYKKSSFIVGLQNSYGFKTKQKEFVNFTEPLAYNPDTKLALQGEKRNQSSYYYNSLGFYLGFSISF
jgi:hypothetical protein